MYEEMMQNNKISSMEKLAREQVDGVIRRHESGRENFIESTIPSTMKHYIHAHEGGCGSILIVRNSYRMISGGQDQTVKIWDSMNGTLTRTLRGCLGSVLDLTVTSDNKSIIAASSKNSLFVWDSETGQHHHTLTGHQDKVCAVDANRVSSRHIVSSGYDHTIRVWDLQKGYCVNTILSGSNCNTLCYSMDGAIIYSGHVDGSFRLWDTRSCQLISEVAAHTQGVTSVCLSQGGNIVLSSGRDNLHNLFDVRSLEVRGTLRANGSRVASNWSRSCISPDDSYVAAGSADGSVYIWSVSKVDTLSTLKGHSVPVLSCFWGGLGKPLVSADKNGYICIWT